MDLEELTHALWEAAEERHTCRLVLQREPLPRLVAPYGICTTSKNQIVLVCWQLMGLTRAGAAAGYRNLMLAEIREVENTGERFIPRDDFNPTDGQYRDWVFHI